MTTLERPRPVMTDLRTELATLVAARICHDLISPVGAIANGLELVQLGGGINGNSPEMQLISDSCENANARIRFLRIAFGAARETAMVSPAEARGVLADLTRHSRLDVSWTTSEDIARTSVQLAFLGLQCVETAMRRGGWLSIGFSGDRITLSGQSEQMSVDPGLWHLLEGGSPAPTGVLGSGQDVAPAHVQFLLLPILAADRGRKLTVRHTAQTVIIEM